MLAIAFDWNLESTWTRSAKRQYLELLEAADEAADRDCEALASIREMVDRGVVRVGALSSAGLPAVSWR